MKKNLFVIIICISICGCEKTQNDSNAETIRVNFSDIKYSEESIDFFSSYKLIQLETNDQCLIGEITKIITHLDRIYILDMYIAESVFIFDNTGKWINTIHRKGKGSEEYINVTDIFVDDQTQSLCLLCRSNKKIMMFDEYGEFQKQEQLPLVWFFNMEKTSHGYIANARNTSTPPNFKSKIYLLSDDIQIIERHFPISKTWESNILGIRTEFAKQNDTIYYFPALENTVYHIYNNTISEVYKYDFGQANVPKDITPKEMDKIPWIEKGKIIAQLRYFAETKDNIITVVLYEGTEKLIAYNKSNKSTRIIQFRENSFIKSSFGDIISLTNQSIISQIEAKFIIFYLNLAKEENDTKTMDALKKAINKPLDDENNPFICIYGLN